MLQELSIQKSKSVKKRHDFVKKSCRVVAFGQILAIVMVSICVRLNKNCLNSKEVLDNVKTCRQDDDTGVNMIAFVLFLQIKTC